MSQVKKQVYIVTNGQDIGNRQEIKYDTARRPSPSADGFKSTARAKSLPSVERTGDKGAGAMEATAEVMFPNKSPNDATSATGVARAVATRCRRGCIFKGRTGSEQDCEVRI
jgi:hypothetical protein